MRIARMADAVVVADLPEGMDAYAGYVDGAWPTFAQVCHRFYPRAHCLSITARGGNARFADCESGDLTAREGVSWLRDRVPVAEGGLWTPQLLRDRGIEPEWRPGLYFPVSWLADVVSALRELAPRLQRTSYCLWGAHWIGHLTDTVPSGYDAMQEEADVSPGYDISVCGPRLLSL